MCRKTGLWILVVVLLLPTLSCTRLPESSAQKGVIVGSVQLPASDSIPSAWGKLVSVTAVGKPSLIEVVVEAMRVSGSAAVGAVASSLMFGVVPLNSVQVLAQPSLSQAKACHL